MSPIADAASPCLDGKAGTKLIPILPARRSLFSCSRVNRAKMLQGRALLYTVTALTASGFMLIGYDNGVLGGVINNEPFKQTFNNPDETLLGTIVAIYEIGCCVGALITAFIGEALGRRKMIAIGAILMLAGTGFQAGVSSSGAMIAARIVSGLGMGAVNSSVPTLQAEVSPKATRGRYVCAQLSALNFGILLACYGFTSVSGSKAWRIPVALQAIFIIPILVLVIIIPESPRWLASHGRGGESLLVLARLQGVSTAHPDVLEQHEEILHAVILEQSIGSGRWSELLKDDAIKSRRRFLIACAIQGFQQLGGINAVIYYSGSLLLVAGLSAHGASLVSGFLFTWFFVASFIPFFLIDSVGRRPLLLATFSLMSLCFVVETGLIWKVQTSQSAAAGAGAAAVLFIYLGLFTTGAQAVVWVYPSEILPLRLRAKGSAVSTAVNWIANYAVVQVTPIALKRIGWRFYIVFAVLNACFVPVMYFFFPETKGLSLESIDLLFAPQLAEVAQVSSPPVEDDRKELVEQVV